VKARTGGCRAMPPPCCPGDQKVSGRGWSCRGDWLLCRQR